MNSNRHKVEDKWPISKCTVRDVRGNTQKVNIEAEMWSQLVKKKVIDRIVKPNGQEGKDKAEMQKWDCWLVHHYRYNLVCVCVYVFSKKLMDVCCRLRRWKMQLGPLRQHVSHAWKKKSRHAWKLYHPHRPPPRFPPRISFQKACDAKMTERIRILQRLGEFKALFSTWAEIWLIKYIWLVSDRLANSWKDTHSLCGRVANRFFAGWF